MIGLRHTKLANNNHTNSSTYYQNNSQTNTISSNFDSMIERNSNQNFVNRVNYRSLSICEGRIKQDLYDFYKKESTRKKFDIILHELKKIENTDNFEMLIEFLNIFTLKFIFSHQYPFEPPKITYYSGFKFANLFDDSENLILEILKKEKWSPVIWLSTLIGSIELIIENNLRNANNIFGNYVTISKKFDYRKRKWRDYLIEAQGYHKDRQIIMDLNCGLKRLKSF